MDGLLKADNKLVGLKQSTRALENGEVVVAYIARDAEAHVVLPFEQMCKAKEIRIIYADTSKDLAKACNIEVPTAVAVVLK